MKKLEKKGFTVIEVVLVLAIAGLIFAMAFIALPALQRNQRDAQRRDDMAIYIDALKKYQTNNRGALPEIPAGVAYINVKKNNGYYEQVNKVNASASASASTSTAWVDFYNDFIKKSFMDDPSGVAYGLKIVNCRSGDIGDDGYTNRTIKDECDYSGRIHSGTYSIKNGFVFDSHWIYTMIGATCDGDHAVGSSNPRKVAVMYIMESSGVYCINS